MEPVDQIKQRLDIATFIQPYVPLKQSGRNLKGLCPFHAEKTPSFMVSEERQTWRCFGCNKGGDIISFYQEIERLDFYEALKDLAERTGVELKTQQPEALKQKANLYEINALAAKFYHYLLTEHAIGKEAYEYVTKSRKLLSSTITSFQMGYAPDNWDKLLKFLKKHKVTEEQAYQAGLLSKGQRGYFDMFRNRVIFPLHDHRGNIVGFAGRVLDPDAKIAKYINSPETPVYIKGNTLYGLYQNAEVIREAKAVVLVEGELDVLSAYQSGIKNIVAVKGTALTQNQLHLLRRYSQTLILALDQDKAGQAATRRSIELAYEAGFAIRIVNLPFGKDIDDLAKVSPKALKTAIEDASPYYDWLLSNIISNYDLEDPQAKAKVAKEALPFIQHIDNEIVKEHYFKQLAKRLDISPQTLMRTQWKLRDQAKQEKRTQPPPKKPVAKDREVAKLQSLLGLLYQSANPQLYMAEMTKVIHDEYIPLSAEKQFWLLLKAAWQKRPHEFSFKQFVATLPAELSTVTDELTFADGFDLSQNPEQLELTIHKTLKELERDLLDSKMKDILRQIKQASKDDQEFAVLSEQLEAIKSQRKSLE